MRKNILICPLNWGLGHATRCVPIVRGLLELGHNVIIAADKAPLSFLQKEFPNLEFIRLPGFEPTYSKGNSQVFKLLKSIPGAIIDFKREHKALEKIVKDHNIDIVISDNRFGCWSKNVYSVYITHQLYPILPKHLRLFQSLVRALHARIYTRYDEVWVPDYRDVSCCLSGDLSHGGDFDTKVKYIGPLSRFRGKDISLDKMSYPVVVILSGLEPQRTLFEKEILQRFENQLDKVLLVRGKVGEPNTTIQKKNITIVSSITDKDLISAVQGARKIIARSGYSTIMDFDALGVLSKAELHPTPGQSEQEYLSSLHVVE